MCPRYKVFFQKKNFEKQLDELFLLDCGDPDEIANGSFRVSEDSEEYPTGEEKTYSSKYPHQVTYSCNPLHSMVPGSENVLKCSNTSFAFEPELPVCLPGN